jgi:hypothetical protein
MRKTPRRLIDAISDRLSYANVMATIAVFGLLAGGGAWAASKIGTADLKNGAVTAKKLRKGAVTTKKIRKGAVTQVKLAGPPALHRVGAPGEPPFASGASNVNPGGPTEPAAFYKDLEGIVHLEGLIEAGTDGFLFNLPPGYRPRPGRARIFTAACDSNCPDTFTATIQMFGAGLVADHDGGLQTYTDGTQVSLDGITFRAGG